MSYLTHERGQYEPPTCPGCQQRTRVDWIDATTPHDLARMERRWVPGRWHCRTEGCAYNDLEQPR